MNRERTEAPRARYDRSARDSSVSTRDRADTLPAIPRHIEARGPQVAAAWIAAQTNPPLEVEIDQAAYHAIDVSLDEARAFWRQVTYNPIGGPPAGYTGSTLLDALPPQSAAIAAALTHIRCQKYEQLLNEQAPDLMRQVTEARSMAEAAAEAKIAGQVDQIAAMAAEIVNDPKFVGSLPLPRPERPDPDLTAMRRHQEALDRLASEIRSVRRRQEAADQQVSTTLTTLAENLTRLLWIGPAGDTYRPDWHAMYEAHERLREIMDPLEADRLWATAEKRWKGKEV